jgi:ligand-binding SRPBCC domain-containing protein
MFCRGGGCMVARPMKGEHELERETVVPRPRMEVFEFFADAENLEHITPPELRFEITSTRPIRMAEGTRIEYRLWLFGVPFTWTSLITRWEPGHSFVDEQIRGPYAKWVHTHSFEDADIGTRVRDHVLYRLPLFPLGEIGYPLVSRQLGRIFEYRARRLRELLHPASDR